MKTLKLIQTVVIVFLLFSCSSDDDGNTQLTNQELLTSGKWYFESKTPGSYTACEKKGYIQFMNDGSAILNSFDDSTGACESLGAVTVTYTLTNDVNLTIVLGSDMESAVIDSISEDTLNLSNSDTGETLLFDKIEG